MDVQHGTLTVPLLRHQRRALSWMTTREGGGSLPVGGLLADDQGLGKTLTTISLIVSSRPPPRAHRPRSATAGQPAPPPRMHPGGTLVVCPTSVLRQWARELASRVSGAAALSVLLYHGPGRSRSALEVARYDVVLTTYAIVSQELAPQRARDAAAAAGGEEEEAAPAGAAAGTGGTSGVLGGITWWRVVLDEAQSIKNSRSLVAASVWALRARRRWCLSGTPLQNSVDDLYSYFRFLHYAPYDDVAAFRSKIREPIRSSPVAGFAALQKVLAAIMLRRTKATQILGEPIVKLPPRTVRLRAVEFSAAERECYGRLQAEYRTRFAEFRAAGTVSNNYVNILYMLLRLRQACNHLALASRSAAAKAEVFGAAKGGGTPSAADVASARRLGETQRAQLRAAAEAGADTCPVCGDMPEESDAVAALCGALFCRQCWSSLCSHGGDEQDACPSCGGQHAACDAFTVPALRVASGLKAHPAAPRGAAAAAAAAEEGLGCGGLAASCKLRAVVAYLNELRTRTGGVRPSPRVRAAAAAASPGGGKKAKRDRAKDARARQELLRDGLRSSDAAMAAALPPLPPVVFGAGLAGAAGGSACLAEPPEKVIIFSQWTGMLNLLEPALRDEGFQYRRLDGTMSLAAREKALLEFEQRPEVCVMLMSLKAAGLGVNLVCANHVLLLDVWWNPTVEEQAIDRSHRIGQRREVFVSRLTVSDTVEDRILALQEHKRALAAAAFGEGQAAAGAEGAASAAAQAGDAQRGRLSVDDLLFLFEQPGQPGAAEDVEMA
jgi:SNF2 family DNA or RNA helicase